MISLALELASWRTLPLGVDVPIEEYQKAIDAWHPDALVLSFVLSRNINKRFQELSRIKKVPVFVGGRSIVNHQGAGSSTWLDPLDRAARIKHRSAHPRARAMETKSWLLVSGSVTS